MLKTGHQKRHLLRTLTDAIANLDNCHSHTIKYELNDPSFTEEVLKIEKKLLALRDKAKRFSIEEPITEIKEKK